MSVRRYRRLFFDGGVVLMPSEGRVLLRFPGDGLPLDLTEDFGVLLGAGLLLAPRDGSSPPTVELAVLETPDRMRVYHAGRRLSEEEIAALFEASLVAALRAAMASDVPAADGTAGDALPG